MFGPQFPLLEMSSQILANSQLAHRQWHRSQVPDTWQKPSHLEKEAGRVPQTKGTQAISSRGTQARPEVQDSSWGILKFASLGKTFPVPGGRVLAAPGASWVLSGSSVWELTVTRGDAVEQVGLGGPGNCPSCPATDAAG